MSLKINQSPIDGLLLIHKEAGGTSHDLVAKVRRILGTRDVGHAGTLDPMAEGLMVLLVGQGTKLSQYILEGNKAYRAGIKLGIETDTLDVTGEILKEISERPSQESLMEAIRAFEGEFEWEVPIYSAAKVQGKRLHEYARKGQEVVRPRKRMKFWDIKFHDSTNSDFEVDIRCSKGSFIRTWIHELGKNLGCGAVMSSLVRTESAPFQLESAISLKDLERIEKTALAGIPAFVTLSQALPGTKRVRVKGQDQQLLKNGQISHDLRSLLITQYRPGDEGLIQIHSEDNKLLALVALEPDKGFVLRRVFN